MKQKVIIIGAGDLGVQVLHHLKQENKAELIGWLDDTIPKGEIVEGIKVLGKICDLVSLDEDFKFVVAIGYNGMKFKQNLIREIKERGKTLYTFIHSSAIIDLSSKIEEGAIIYPGCIVDINVVIESGVILNNGVIVSHDTVIKEASFIAPGVVLSGHVTIGQRCFIGAGSTIKNDLIIENDVVIGSGANVYKSINESGTYVQKIILNKLK